MDNWVSFLIDHIGSVKTGPFGSQLHESDYIENNGTPIVTVEHLSERGLVHKNLPLVSNEDKQRLGQYVLATNDIVFSRVGSVDRCSIVSKKEDGWLFSGRLLRIRPNQNQVYSPFLIHLFNTEEFKHHMRSIAVGGTMPSLNTQLLSQVRVLLPPLPEQKAIADALQTWDTAIEKTEALVAAKERQFGWLIHTLINTQSENPAWAKMCLGDIGEVSSAGVDKKIVTGEGEVRLLNYLDVYKRNMIFSKEISHKVTASKSKIEKCSIRKGDIFFIPSSEISTDIGKSSVAMEEIPNGVYSYHIVRLRPAIKMDVLYSAFAFNTHSFYKQASRLAAGSGQRYVISQSSFRAMKVSLPPYPEQKRIADILNTAQQEINLLKNLVVQYRTQKRGIMQRLLTGQRRVVVPGERNSP